MVQQFLDASGTVPYRNHPRAERNALHGAGTASGFQRPSGGRGKKCRKYPNFQPLAGSEAHPEGVVLKGRGENPKKYPNLHAGLA